MTESVIDIALVFPELLGTYGDSGNGHIVAARAAWRGLSVDLVDVHAGDRFPTAADIYCLGGGEDGPQVESADRLASGALARAVARGATVLAVCAGYQIAGVAFPDADGRPQTGLGLLDVTTAKGPGLRAVGEMLADVTAGPDRTTALRVGTLTGFENHGGVTRLGPDAAPLAQVTVGVGNGDGEGTEGAWAGRVVGTYLHGPVLARNPALADLLLAWATGETPVALADEEERALRAEQIAAAAAPVRWRRLLAARSR